MEGARRTDPKTDLTGGESQVRKKSLADGLRPLLPHL
jgi:hypothetical protein